ncbi:MAG: hypothetical protein Q7S11_01005 [bacterium]|nr:hypothetical protein [bacterium]
MASLKPELLEPDLECLAQQIRTRFKKDCARRKKYRYTSGDVLRILVEGNEYEVPELTDGSRLISLDACDSDVDIYGEDEFGELRLTMFRIPGDVEEGNFRVQNVNKYVSFKMTILRIHFDVRYQEYAHKISLMIRS